MDRALLEQMRFCREYANFGPFFTQILLRQMRFDSILLGYLNKKWRVEPLHTTLVVNKGDRL